jgi:hypothetical protein
MNKNQFLILLLSLSLLISLIALIVLANNRTIQIIQPNKEGNTDKKLTKAIKNTIDTAPNNIKEKSKEPVKQETNKETIKKSTLLKCSTYVSNFTAGTDGWKDLCCFVEQGEPYNLNAYIYDEWRKKKENEGYKFSVTVIDNSQKTKLSYTSSFWLYEDNTELKQYHNIHKNHEIKALIFDKRKYCWQILLYQDYEYKILSCYWGNHFINAFDIARRNSKYNY